MKRFSPKSEFGRNVITLITGTTVAQFIPVAVSPLLTRMYSPADFGVLALFMSLTLVLSSVATGRYEFAILSPELEEDAINIGGLSMVIALAMSVLLALVVAVSNHAIAHLLNNPALANWLYLVPLTVLFQAFLNVLNYLNSRKKNFKDIAAAKVHKSVIMIVIQLLFGLVVHGAAGLILGFFFGAIFANLKLMRNVGSLEHIGRTLSVASMKHNGREYIDFPRYSSWSGLANTLAGNLTNFLISGLYSASVLGFYSIAQRVLGMPATLIGTAVSQVFLQKASQERREKGSAARIFKKTLVQLTILSIPIFLVAYLLVEDVFVLVFGEAWRTAGIYARILMPLFAIRFVATPLTMMNVVDKKNKTGMVANFILLAITAVTITIAGRMGLAVTQMLELFMVTSCIYYLIYLFTLYRQTMRSGVQVRESFA